MKEREREREGAHTVTFSYFKNLTSVLVMAINSLYYDSEQKIFLLFSSPTSYNRFTTNQCLIFCTDGTRSPSPHHAFVFYLWMKHFVCNVSRQAFRALSILMYIPIIQRHLNKAIWIEVGECVISCHIIHNVLEASSEDSVGVGVGGMETWLLINLVTVVDSQRWNKHKRLA